MPIDRLSYVLQCLRNAFRSEARPDSRPNNRVSLTTFGTRVDVRHLNPPVLIGLSQACRDEGVLSETRVYMTPTSTT